MNIRGKHYRTIWVKPDDPSVIQVIDQRFLPHQFIIEELRTVQQVTTAIRDMHIRGAGLIGVTAGYGMYIAAIEGKGRLSYIREAAEFLRDTRPTAVNLVNAVKRQIAALEGIGSDSERIKVAFDTAKIIADEDVGYCKAIGEHGLRIIADIAQAKSGVVNVLTHCNAGWLAFVDYGSALAPIYAAYDKGIKVHVWVDETRPRNQGASLTAWELCQHGVSHTVIADNTGGHLMQHGKVDLVIVGTDRTTRAGDVANKIGTYLKALAAKDNNIPFYVAVPSSSLDWEIRDGIQEITIEERCDDEVKYIEGFCDGEIRKVCLMPEGSAAVNYGFDVTPARLITGLITERGICKAEEASIVSLYPEKRL